MQNCKFNFKIIFQEVKKIFFYEMSYRLQIKSEIVSSKHERVIAQEILDDFDASSRCSSGARGTGHKGCECVQKDI